MMEFTEDFLKLVQIALVVVGALSIFFTYVSYNILIKTNEANREATLLGNILLASDCLTYQNNVGLFEESKLIAMSANSSCLKYPYGSVSIDLVDVIPSQNWDFEVNAPVLNGEENFYISVKLNDGKVEKALMVVKV